MIGGGFVFLCRPMQFFLIKTFLVTSYSRPEPDRWELKLYFEQLDSDLGNIPKTVFVCQLGTEKRFQYLKSVEEGQPSLDIFSEPRREMRKIIDPMTQPCGLRKLVREIQGDLQIVCLPYNPI